MEKEPAKWRPLNLKRFNANTKKLRQKIGIKRLKEIDEEIKRLLYIKEIVYGYGIPPKNSPFYKDVKNPKV